MNVTLLDRSPARNTDQPGQSHLGFIDCDVHPFIKSGADFDPFLSARWREHRQTMGNRSRQGLAKALIISKQEKTVLFEGPAQRASKLVSSERRNRALVEEIARV